MRHMSGDWVVLTDDRKKGLVEALRVRHRAYVEGSSSLGVFVRDAFETIERKQEEVTQLLVKIENAEPADEAVSEVVVERLPDGGLRLTVGEEERALIAKAMDRYHQNYLRHPQIIREMVLIYAFAMFDGLVADVMRLLLVHVPSALRSARKISYEEALNFPTREHLVVALADREVQEATRLNAVDQMRYFESKYHVDCLALAGVPAAALQLAAYQRNLFVHNSGIVDVEYARLAGTEKAVGSRIVLHDDMVKDHLSMLRSIARELVVGLIGKFSPE